MVVRGCVHGGVVICEVRVAASLVVHDRADRAVPCAPLLGGVGDAARDPARRPPARSVPRGSMIRRPRPGSPRAPAPGGVDSVMSPRVALCQACSRGSRASGFRQARLAWREPEWIPMS